MKSPDHYYFPDFLHDLDRFGLDNEAARLRALDKAVDAALELRNAEANKTLRENICKIVPLLRPWHKRQAATLQIYGWKFC